ncbi:MAG: glycosyltransferase family 2 protein [Candidatus Hydrogenedentota bacterium]
MSPAITVVVPSYNPAPDLLRALYDSLCQQTFTNFEVIIVDDASRHGPYDCITDPRFRVLYQEENRGPAACRNAGARAAQSACIFFTDTDCQLAPDTLANTVAAMREEDIVMGNTVTKAATRFGKAVALLGFPGGGILGFDKVWRVNAAGYTNSISSCSVAFRKTVFERLGRFDESFPVAGGEDTVLARHAIEAGYRIRYVPGQRVYHVEKRRLRDFLRWQIVRGRGNFHIRRRVRRVGSYLWLRVWTFKNSLTAAGPLYALPVLALIVLSVVYQSVGYYLEKMRHSREP